MRYARNLADGHGLVWNPGGPYVQGFTNPLWTFIMFGVHVTGIPPRLTSVAMMALGALILLGASRSARALALTITGRPEVASIALALTAFSYPLVFWTLRGMEVGLLAWLITAAADRAIRFARDGAMANLSWLALTLTLALWTRTDALVPVLALGAYATIARSSGWRAIAAAAAAVAAIGVAGPLLFGWWYYGSALPNTYYLKLAGVTLADRLARGIPALILTIGRSLVGAILPIAALALARPRGRMAREMLLLISLVFAQCAYSVYVGGDAWEWMGYANRYIAVILPSLSVLTAAGIDGAIGNARSGRLLGPAFAVAVAAHAALAVMLARANRGIDGFAVELFRADAARFAVAISMIALALVAVSLVVTRRRTIAGVAVVVWLLTSGVPFGRWVLENGFAVPEDERAARLGLLLRTTLAAEASYAVCWAGSIPYFAERTAIDLLGKSDPVVARMPPAIPEFVPGHNKWNLEYSLGRLRPDLACDLPRRASETPYLNSQGYRSIGGTCFIRETTRIDTDRLAAGIASLYPSGIAEAMR